MADVTMKPKLTVPFGNQMTSDELKDFALNNRLKEIELLWTGVNQSMFLLAKDDLLNTEGYRRLKALLKNDIGKPQERKRNLHGK